MDRLQRLLRVAASRNAATEYGGIRVRLLKSQIGAMREQLEKDGMSANVLFEAVLRGYINRHPAVLAMIDQWKRDEHVAQREIRSLNDRDVADIYAELGSGIIEE